MKKLFLLLGLASVLVMFAGCAGLATGEKKLSSISAVALNITPDQITQVFNKKQGWSDLEWDVTLSDGSTHHFWADDMGRNATHKMTKGPGVAVTNPQVTAVPKQQ